MTIIQHIQSFFTRYLGWIFITATMGWLMRNPAKLKFEAIDRLRRHYNGWRWLVGCCRHFRNNKPTSRDIVYTQAMLADICHELGCNFSYLVALRGLRAEASHLLLKDIELPDRNTLLDHPLGGFLKALILAGRSEMALCLAEQLGASFADRQTLRSEDFSRAAHAAIHAGGQMRVGCGWITIRVKVNLLTDALHIATAVTRWLPGALAAEAGGLGMLLFIKLMNEAKGNAWHEYRRIDKWHVPTFGLRFAKTPSASVILLTVATNPTGIVYSLRSFETWWSDSKVGWHFDCGQGQEGISFRPDSLLDGVCEFYLFSRVLSMDELQGPQGALTRMCSVLDPALSRISTAPSVRRMLVLRTSGVVQAIPHAALLINHDEYLIDRFDLAYQDDLPYKNSAESNVSITVLVGSSDLEWTSVEATSILKLASDRGIRILNSQNLDGSFCVTLNEDSLRSALQQGSIVHICGHFNHDATNTILSTFVAADGKSFALQKLISFYPRRQLELVFVSACESGTSGDETDGTSGNASRVWRSTFGAQSTITTSWRIRDAAAARFSAAFYRNLFSGSSRARSLALAQLEIARLKKDTSLLGSTDIRERFLIINSSAENRNDSSRPIRADHDPCHVRNWAGFRLTGATGPLYPAPPNEASRPTKP